MVVFQPSAPLDKTFRDAVSKVLDQFIEDQRERYPELSIQLPEVFDLANSLCSGGKRIRPAFCYWSYVSATEEPPEEQVLTAAASLDLLHVSALVHDDLIDASTTRRGLPAAHVQFQALHRHQGGVGQSADYGRAGAVLLGDLLLAWSAELFDNSGLSLAQSQRALPQLHAMRTEVNLGQLLDIRAQGLPASELTQQLANAVLVSEYKTASYSIRRPCLLGSLIGGQNASREAQLAKFGSPLGRAFQLRDDILGIFGDPATTGKPAGDDLREGKRTVLLTLALTQAEPSEAVVLSSLVGKPSLSDKELACGREIIETSGALATAEARIQTEFDRALTALDNAEITTPGRIALTQLAEMSVHRAT